MVEESIHVVFDESDNCILSEGFNESNLNKHYYDKSEDKVDANDQDEDGKRNMQEPIQSLEEVEENLVEHIEDSQTDLEIKAHDLERNHERTIFDTPTKDSSKEVAASSLNDQTPSILRRRFRLSSQHPP